MHVDYSVLKKHHPDGNWTEDQKSHYHMGWNAAMRHVREAPKREDRIEAKRRREALKEIKRLCYEEAKRSLPDGDHKTYGEALYSIKVAFLEGCAT